MLMTTYNHKKAQFPLSSLAAVLIVLIATGPVHSYTSLLYGECVKGNGIEKTVERKMSTINILEVSGPIKLNVLSNQIEQHVRISGDENILPIITTVSQGNKLNIFPQRAICTDQNITIDISVGNLIALIAAGPGETSVKEINGGRFSLVLNDSGDVELQGIPPCWKSRYQVREILRPELSKQKAQPCMYPVAEPQMSTPPKRYTLTRSVLEISIISGIPKKLLKKLSASEPLIE